MVVIIDANNQWTHDKAQVQNLIRNCFEHQKAMTLSKIFPLVFSKLSNEDWGKLNRPYTNSDIDMVIKHMGTLKAPGPDGFQALFYQKNWNIVAPNVYAMVKSILEGKGLPESLNETFLVLIPKIDAPEISSKFRRIGICNVTYLIITKAIVNSIKSLLPKITSSTQTSFVPGRQITDNIVIVQEVLHMMKRMQRGKGYMTIKIDFEKAYDRLKWLFIRDTLVDMNFPLSMFQVIMECVSSPSMRILWNEEQT